MVTASQSTMEKKSANSPDEIRTFDNGKLEITTFKDGTTIGKATFNPGWSWENASNPLLKQIVARHRILNT